MLKPKTFADSPSKSSKLVPAPLVAEPIKATQQTVFDYFNDEDDVKPTKTLPLSPPADKIIKLKTEMSSTEKEKRRVNKRLR